LENSGCWQVFFSIVLIICCILAVVQNAAGWGVLGIIAIILIVWTWISNSK